MFERRFRTAAAGVALAIAVGVAGCESAPPAPVHRESTKEYSAKVVGVDKSRRRVSLEGEDGKVVHVVCGPEVRNFDRIGVGDTVSAVCYESVDFAVLDPSKPSDPTAAVVGAGRAAPGERPAGAVGALIETTVTFQSYDDGAAIVTFTDQDGQPHAARVEKADGREFAKKLKTGDRVVIQATETVAIRVDAAK